MTIDNKCVLFTANRAYALSSSRLSFIAAFAAAGWRVVAATANDSDCEHLLRAGAELVELNIRRGGLSPFGDSKALRRFGEIFRAVKPGLVHNFHAKPAILGSLAARRVLGERVAIVNTVTGLGQAFVTGGVKARLAGFAYQLSSRKADAVVFQNRDDRDLFLDNGWVAEDRAHLIIGSGVDLERFEYVDRSAHNAATPTVVMIGRLLWQKGIREYAEIAKRVRAHLPGARFILAGEEDALHADAVDMDWLRAQEDVEYVGRLNDIGSLLAAADLFVFPSYYREGVPRVVMEAAATGMPAIGFDAPGIREAIVDAQTGFLVPVHDTDAMLRRTEELLKDRRARVEMGRAARELAENLFDRDNVHRQYMRLYQSLGADIS